MAKKIKSPIPNPNTSSNKQSKPVFDFYLDMFTLREKPITAEWIEKFALRLVSWAITDPNALTISEFYIAEGVNRTTYNKWCEIYPYLKDAHEFALQAIGNRRMGGGLTRKYSEGLVKYTQPMFDPEFKEMVKFWTEQAKIKNEANVGPANIAVYMDGVPLTDVVPVKE